MKLSAKAANGLGDRIRKRRRALIEPEVTIEELAIAAGIDKLTLGKIERGETINPGIWTVEAINNALTRLEAPPEKETLRT